MKGHPYGSILKHRGAPPDPCKGLRREVGLWRFSAILLGLGGFFGWVIWAGLEAASRQ